MRMDCHPLLCLFASGWSCERYELIKDSDNVNPNRIGCYIPLALFCILLWFDEQCAKRCAHDQRYQQRQKHPQRLLYKDSNNAKQAKDKSNPVNQRHRSILVCILFQHVCDRISECISQYVFAVTKSDKKICAVWPYFHERTSRFLDRTCELGHVVSTKHIHCKIQRTDHDGNHSEHCIECIRVGRLSVESHVVFNAFRT